MKLHSTVDELKGVGPQLAKKLHFLGITTVFDLIDYLPRRYDDYSVVQHIAHINPGPVTLKAVIKQVQGRYVRRGMHITEAVASDDTGSVKLVWFNQPYREKSLKMNHPYFISGEFSFKRTQLVVTNPSTELVSDFPVHTARVIPVYKETKGLTSKQIRASVAQTLSLVRKLPETLPAWIVEQQGLVSAAQAYEAIHFPESSEQLATAKHRFAFEEVFRLTLASLMTKQVNSSLTALPILFSEDLAKTFVSHVPFALTNAQRKAVWAIYQDIQKPEPMNRLLEGDVGSGKTLVAAMAAAMTMHAGYQVCLMAPTELLARQHAQTLYDLLEPLGLADQLSLLVGGMKPAQKKRAKAAAKDEKVKFLIGTHALIQDDVDLKNLALVIVDEQHRFGVEQRKKLMKKSGHAPHVLSMSATPIPRSLSLTLYGELDITILDEKPAERKPILTTAVPPTDRKKIYEHLEAEIKQGRQVFVVCPLISESESLPVTSAEKAYEALAKGPFKNRRVGLLHGKMKPADKDNLMQSFVAHEIDILVSTTVIEVGVDVPNATVMLVENPERFGLAQLHQLRGRVGRSEHQGHCYLMLADSKAPSQRLRALVTSHDGFRLAELDLQLRGPGAIYGTMQHGALDLRVAQLSDHKLIATARQTAKKFLDKGENLLQYKELHQHVTDLQKVTQLN